MFCMVAKQGNTTEDQATSAAWRERENGVGVVCLRGYTQVMQPIFGVPETWGPRGSMRPRGNTGDDGATSDGIMEQQRTGTPPMRGNEECSDESVEVSSEITGQLRTKRQQCGTRRSHQIARFEEDNEGARVVVVKSEPESRKRRVKFPQALYPGPLTIDHLKYNLPLVVFHSVEPASSVLSTSHPWTTRHKPNRYLVDTHGGRTRVFAAQATHPPVVFHSVEFIHGQSSVIHTVLRVQTGASTVQTTKTAHTIAKGTSDRQLRVISDKMSSRSLPPLSMPNLFDHPVVMWATETDVPGCQGLTLPVVEPMLSRQSRPNCWPPLPWQWFYTRFTRQDTYWTALCPTSVAYEGLLEALGNNELVEIRTTTGVGWRLSDVDGWQRLENLLQRLLSAMTAAWSLDFQTPLLVRIKQLSPWPLAYRYADVWPTRKQAKSATNTARAVFRLIIASITYASSLTPDDWLEFLHRRDVLTTEETNLIRRSPICQATDWISGEPYQRIRCILDMRTDFPLSFLEEVKRITERFNSPIWFYYGDSLTQRHTNPWYDAYLPSDADIRTSRSYGHTTTVMNWNDDGFGDTDYTQDAMASYVSRAGPSRTGWSPPTHEPPPATSPAQPKFPPLMSLPNSPDPSSPVSRRVVVVATAPTSHLRNSETRQHPGQTPAEFFAEVDREIVRRMGRMGEEERANVVSRMNQHKELQCPDRTHQCSVYIWHAETDGSLTRTYLPHEKWSKSFEETTTSQRRYNPVRNEFDICKALDPPAVTEEDDDYANWDHTPSSLGLSLEHDQGEELFTTVQHVGDPTSSASRGSTGGAQLEKTLTSERGLHTAAYIREHTDRPEVSARTSYARRRATEPIKSYPFTITKPTTASSILTAAVTSQSCTGTVNHALDPRHYSCRQSSPDSSIVGHVVDTPVARAIVYHLVVLTQYIGVNPSIAIPHHSDDDRPTAKTVRQILGCVHAEWDTQTMELARWVVSILSHHMLAVNAMATQLLDVDPRFPQRHPIRCRQDVIIRTWREHQGNRENLWYFVLPVRREDDNVPFIICLNDLTNVNYLLRSCSSSSMYTIASQLVQHGTPFKTLRLCQTVTQLPRTPPMPMFYDNVPLGLGTVPNGFVFGPDQYQEYEYMRNRVINSHHGRAARLALESNIDKAIVLQGPSGFHTRGDHLPVGGRDYVDDTLSRHQEDIICGVYRVLPENSNEGLGRSAWRSWWPSASTWAASGMSVNYWSLDNERWFKDRLKKIHEQQAQPYAANEWRNNLNRRHTNMANFRRNIRCLAIDSLPQPL
ncbi:hypothetical protein BDY19DRAFT_908119 [Irpex rosettiformis]|uniref:Uncharacterized protein n=1 Tax=Irpex rosettiformis TaxID=378272 RepID=A0ACB8TXI3_9APHY|nr:hypothetical protein BDY19DRAFT_908119 [Irpex rosettiformis]